MKMPSALIRQAVARHLTPEVSLPPAPVRSDPVTFLTHASHFRHASRRQRSLPD